MPVSLLHSYRLPVDDSNPHLTQASTYFLSSIYPHAPTPSRTLTPLSHHSHTPALTSTITPISRTREVKQRPCQQIKRRPTAVATSLDGKRTLVMHFWTDGYSDVSVFGS